MMNMWMKSLNFRKTLSKFWWQQIAKKALEIQVLLVIIWPCKQLFRSMLDIIMKKKKKFCCENNIE